MKSIHTLVISQEKFQFSNDIVLWSVNLKNIVFKRKSITCFFMCHPKKCDKEHFDSFGQWKNLTESQATIPEY